MSSLFEYTKLIWIALLTVFATTALAEQPQMVGQFQRSDGTVIRAMEMNIDGVVGFVGYMCWFALPAGKDINEPRASGSCVVRTGRTGAEVYNFPFSSRWFPVANRVLRFDGYRFTQVTTPWRYGFSPFVHTSRYFSGYLIALGIFTPFLFFGVWVIKKTPARRWWMLLRAALILAGLSIAAAFGMFMVMYGPYSLGIWFTLVAIYIVLYLWLIKFVLGLRKYMQPAD